MPNQPIKKENSIPASLRVVTLLLFLSSCVYDPYYDVVISNKSDQEVLLEIKYDRSAMHPSDNGKYFMLCADAASAVEGGQVISTDTINWILKFKLEPEEHFTLERRPGIQPNFKEIKSLHVYNKDTLLLNSKEKMFDFFKKKEGYKYEFEIK